MGKWTFEILLWGAGKSRLEKLEFLGGDKAAVEVMFIAFFPNSARKTVISEMVVACISRLQIFSRWLKLKEKEGREL